MKPTTNPALERDALYAKSQVYIRRGFRAQTDGDTEEYQLWASLALELLGKAALAKVHPALVADPTHYQSLFAACGRQLSPDTKTITAKTLFERLRHIEKGFDSRHQKFCEQMALRRNAELHSGESPFSGMSAEAWEREFWGAVETILRCQGESLESWLGTEGAKVPAQIIYKAAEAMEWAIKHRVARCKEDFEQKYKDAKKRAKAIKESKNFHWWDFPDRLQLSGDAYDDQECPACGGHGVSAGMLWNEELSEDQKPSDPATEWVDREFIVEEFVCPVCQLHLFGAKEIDAAGLPEEFSRTEAREREFEPEYGND